MLAVRAEQGNCLGTYLKNFLTGRVSPLPVRIGKLSDPVLQLTVCIAIGSR